MNRSRLFVVLLLLLVGGPGCAAFRPLPLSYTATHAPADDVLESAGVALVEAGWSVGRIDYALKAVRTEPRAFQMEEFRVATLTVTVLDDTRLRVEVQPGGGLDPRKKMSAGARARVLDPVKAAFASRGITLEY